MLADFAAGRRSPIQNLTIDCVRRGRARIVRSVHSTPARADSPFDAAGRAHHLTLNASVRRLAKRPGRIASAPVPAAPKIIGVLGADTMGAGIAQLAALAGARTLVHDHVIAIVDAPHDELGEERYRVAGLLRRMALDQ